MRVPTLLRYSFVATFATALAAPLRAQCTTAFEPGLEQAVAGLPVAGTVTADVGLGSELFVYEQLESFAQSLRVWSWDGTTRRPLTTLHGFALDQLPVVRDAVELTGGTGTQVFFAGHFRATTTAPQATINVMRWNGTNILPATLGDEWDYGVNDLCVHDDGTGNAVYAGGDFVSGPPPVARWNGTSWVQVGTNLSGRTHSLVSYDDGNGAKLYAAGEYTIGNGVVRLDGTTWTFLASVGGRIDSFEVADLGAGSRLYAGGPLNAIGTVGVWRVVQYDGTTWAHLGGGIGGGNVYTLRAFVDGGQTKLAVGGAFTSAGGVPAANCAVWDGAQWSALGSGTNGTVWSLDVFDTGNGPRLIAGGEFQIAGGLSLPHLAQWTGSAWARLSDGAGADEGITALVQHTDAAGTALFAGGSFTRVGPITASRIARFDGAQWTALGSGFAGQSSLTSPGTPYVSALASFDDGQGPGLFAGGNFATAGGVAARGIAVWRNGAWSGVGGSILGTGEVRALCVHDDGSGPALYAAGLMPSLGGVATLGLARWNGTTWTAINAPSVPYYDCQGAGALVVWNDGGGPKLYVGGRLVTSGIAQQTTYHLGRWDGTTLSVIPGLGNFLGATAGVSALATFDDGTGSKLCIGGRFDHALGVTVNNVATWDGVQLASLGAGFPPNGTSKWTVAAFTTFDAGAGSDAQLYAGGNIGMSNGVAYNGLARWDGSAWQPVGTGPAPQSSIVLDFASFDDGLAAGTPLYVAGAFQAIDGVGSANLARMRTNCPDPEIFCSGDGTASACPCVNAGASGHGCPTSYDPNGAQLTASGVPSVSADSMLLTANGVTFSVVSFFQGTQRFNGGAGAVLGDGLFCTGGALVRLGPIFAATGSAQFPAAGAAALSTQGLVPASGGMRTYQVWFRDAPPYCTSATFNTTNGIEITYAP